MDTPGITMEKKRPTFLTVLCMIAFFHVGVTILMGLFSTIASTAPSAFRGMGYLDDIGGMAAAMGGVLFSASSLVLAVIAFFGIIQLWNQLRVGFYTFTVPMILFLVSPFVLLNLPFKWLIYLMLPHMIVVPLLIMMFAVNLKKLD